MKKVAVIGGGCAGLASAHELLKKGYDVSIIEKEDVLGGISTSVSDGKRMFDYGPHAYHIKGTHIDNLFMEIMEETLKEKSIRQKIIIKGKYYTYPLVLYELLSKLNPFVAVRVAVDYVVAQLWYALFPIPDDNFRNWGVKRFGWTLYNLNFGQYTKRLWGLEPGQISAKLASQKLHKLNLKDIVTKLLGGKGEEQMTYWRKFWYPEKGIQTFFAKFESKLSDGGVKIYKGIKEFEFIVRNNKLSSIIFEHNGDNHILDADFVVSSVHPGVMIKSIKDADRTHIKNADNLKYRSMIVVNLIYDKTKMMDEHWIYLLDPEFKFSRFTEQKNMGMFVCPENETYLSFEISCNCDDDVWNMTDEELLSYLENDIRRIEKLKDRKYKDYKIIRSRYTYPLYTIGFDKILNSVLKYMESFINLYSIGRMGLYLNSDMHDSMEMGVSVADSINNGEMPSEWYKRAVNYLECKMEKVKV